MNNSQVAHVWAQQRKQSGKGSSFYFDGPTIYSYGRHFPIAAFTNNTDANGERIVLFTTRGYSNSTSKHIGHARSALHGLPVRVFYVPNVDGSHRQNVLAYVETFANALKLASRARNRKAQYLAEAAQAQSECADYCRAFGETFPAELDAEISPELIAAAKVAADAAAKKRAEANRAAIARAEEYERGMAIVRAGERDAWMQGRSNATYTWAGHFPTMLRLSGDTVETSRGARVPADAARALWAIVTRCKRDGRSLDAGTDGPSVGDFQLRSIDANGNCIVGCHSLDYAETSRFAAAQGWE